MKATQLRIHNFRSILDAEIEVHPYGLLVGPNGAGKSNALAAIRAFYDDFKFAQATDFPKMATADAESWVEIEFTLSAEEAETIKQEYLDNTKTSFRVRRYFLTEEKDDEGKSRAGGLFAYERGVLSASRFYGAKNVQAGKVGKVVYIPAVTKLDDHTKLSGPSSLRELINLVLRAQLENSEQFSKLTTAFGEFRTALKPKGGPLDTLETAITQEISDWGHSFALDVRSMSVDELLKGLVAPKIIDGDLEAELEPGQFGHGFQRHLVYSLMMLAARYGNVAKPKAKKKEFDPDLFWVLYEEPEAFLHPPQAEVLNVGLRKFSEISGHQVLITTHSPHFASKNLKLIPSLVRLSRENRATQVGQVLAARVKTLFEDNQDVIEQLRAANLEHGESKLDMESVKYSLWLNPQRASALFAQRVLLVEGPTESALVAYLIDEGKIALPVGGLAVIDTLGKWNMPRFMNLLGVLRIPHAVLYDSDQRPAKDDKHVRTTAIVNGCIQKSRNAFTMAVEGLPDDVEAALGLPKCSQPYAKPQYVLHAVGEGQVDGARLLEFTVLLQRLVPAPVTTATT
jgi:putative ATP-dependent endonuclease of the OLD family